MIMIMIKYFSSSCGNEKKLGLKSPKAGHKPALGYLLQNSQALKKECNFQKGYGEKNVKSKVMAKKWQVNGKRP